MGPDEKICRCYTVFKDPIGFPLSANLALC
jgi:hypothetical protein